MGLFTHSYETEEGFWRSVLTGEKPALPMGQVRKFFSLFSSNDRCKACNIPFTGKSSWFLIYGASGLIYRLTFVNNGKIFLRNILVVLMSVSPCSLLTLGVQQSQRKV